MFRKKFSNRSGTGFWRQQLDIKTVVAAQHIFRHAKPASTCILPGSAMVIYFSTEYRKKTTSLPKVIWEEGRVASLSHTLRRKDPIGYNGAPQIRPKKYPFPWTDPQTALPASSLGPRPVRPMLPNGIRIRSVFSTMHCTDRRTDRPTDRPRESLMTIGRCATRATRFNNWCASTLYWFSAWFTEFDIGWS